MAESIAFCWPTGKTVKLEIVRDADSFSLDWADNTFKNAGWTTRQQALSEGAGTLIGRYTTSATPTAWTDGSYDFVVTETTIATGAVAVETVDVQAGRFIAGAGIAQAAWTFDVTSVDENSFAGLRAATKLMNLFRRFFGKVTQTGTQQKIFKNDGSTVLATLPVSNVSGTQTLGPGA
jgi:hypothetical protein